MRRNLLAQKAKLQGGIVAKGGVIYLIQILSHQLVAIAVSDASRRGSEQVPGTALSLAVTRTDVVVSCTNLDSGGGYLIRFSLGVNKRLAEASTDPRSHARNRTPCLDCFGNVATPRALEAH